MVLKYDVLNYRHLEIAGLPALLENYITECLHRGTIVWPTEDTCNVVAVVLFLAYEFTRCVSVIMQHLRWI